MLNIRLAGCCHVDGRIPWFLFFGSMWCIVCGWYEILLQYLILTPFTSLVLSQNYGKQNIGRNAIIPSARGSSSSIRKLLSEINSRSSRVLLIGVMLVLLEVLLVRVSAVLLEALLVRVSAVLMVGAGGSASFCFFLETTCCSLRLWEH